MRRRIGVSVNNNLQGDNLIINNASTATYTFSYDGLRDLKINLPTGNGTIGQVMTNDGTGKLYWSSGGFGATGATGLNGTNGTSGSSGTSGINGTMGVSGTNGTSGSSGTSGINGTMGVSGTNGTSGTSAPGITSGTSGTSGSSGISGSSGTSGTSGTNGLNGTMGPAGSSGTSGTRGTSGTSGLNGLGSIASGTINSVVKFTGATALGDSTITNISNQTNIGFDSAYVRMTSDASRLYFQVGTNSTSLSGNVLSFGKIGSTAYAMRIDSVNDRVQFADGSSATPSITFGNDLSMGLYRQGTGNMDFVVGGNVPLRLNNQSVQFRNGTIGVPGISFLSDSTTGFSRFSSSQINVSVGGTEVSRFTPAGILNIDGSSATPSISFISDTNTGFYKVASDAIGISTGGATWGYFSTTQLLTDKIIRIGDGTVAQPGYSFGSETSMGLYRQGTNNMGLVVNGTEILRLNQAQAQMVNGSVAAPAYSFIINTNTGMYRAGTNIIGFSSAGVLKFTIAASYINSVNPHWFSDGTNAAPSISFTSDTTTGFYRVGAGQIGISNAGVSNVIFGSTNSISNQTFFNKSVNHTPTISTITTSTYSIDMSASNIFILTLTSSTVLSTTNRNVGSYMIYVKQDATGGRLLTLSTDGQFVGATAISISTTPNSLSVIQLVCLGTYSHATSQKNLINL